MTYAIKIDVLNTCFKISRKSTIYVPFASLSEELYKLLAGGVNRINYRVSAETINKLFSLKSEAFK